MKFTAFWSLAFLACSAFADDTITDPVSAVVSYSFANSTDDALTGDGIGSAVVSYQYFELIEATTYESPKVSYDYLLANGHPFWAEPFINVPYPINPRLFDPFSSVNSVEGDSLVVVTHGWIISFDTDLSWVDTMAESIRDKAPIGWQVQKIEWRYGAWMPTPDLALVFAKNLGGRFGKKIAGPWKHIHFIAHSAGAAYIEAATATIKEKYPEVEIHCTFLDPYLGIFKQEKNNYGAHANWSDNYFSHDWTRGLTEGNFTNAVNVNVTALDPNSFDVPISGDCGLTVCDTIKASPGITDGHSWPHEYYQATITNSQFSPGLGFGISKESGGWENRFRYTNGSLTILGNNNERVISSLPPKDLSQLNVSELNGLKSPFGNSQLDPEGRGLSLAQVLSPNSKSKLMTKATESDEIPPVWYAFEIGVTNAMNYVAFDAKFSDSVQSPGLLTVYWNTNQIGFVDESAVLSGVQHYAFALPQLVTEGIFSLGFRLDGLTNELAGITITNIHFGVSSVPETSYLSVSKLLERPLISLNATAEIGHLLEKSMNLINWNPAALLISSNTTSLFLDSNGTNQTQFYRIMRP